MRKVLAILPLAVLFIANVVPSKAQKTAPEAEVVVVVREGAPLELACALRVEQRAEWRREEGALPPELAAAAETAAPAGGLTARLRAPAARPHLAGVYSCARGPHAQRLRVVVEPRADPSDTDTTAATTTASVTTTLKPPLERAPAVAGSEDAPGNIQYYDVPRNTSFTCSLTNSGNSPVVWEKNSTEISQVSELKERYKIEDNGAKLIIPRSTEDDYGNYSCKVGEARQYWQLHARPYSKLPSTDSSVVEGQKLKLVCRLVGKPLVPVDWWYNKDHTSYDAEEKNLGIKVESSGRVKLGPSESGVQDGELVIEEAARADAGAYACAPRAGAAARSPHDPAKTVLRVKDMYAALWPFLGICAEVLVLCAIILVYEKRRTKPELDDSDTDNHDQKKS